MRILALDTSNNNNEVAIIEFNSFDSEYKIISYNKITDLSTQAETLILSIEKCLKDADIWYQDLDFITSAKGPGNFTGIRIGFTVAKIIHSSINQPLITLNNLEIIAHNYIEDYQGKLLVVLDAKLNEFFIQEFLLKDKELILINKEPLLINDQEINNYLPEADCLIVGSGKEIAANLIENKSKITISNNKDQIDMLNLAKLAMKYQQHYPEKIKNEILYVRQPNISKSKQKKRS